MASSSDSSTATRGFFTVALSGAVLFVAELEAGQRLLPRLGGGPAVWASTVVVFQVLLLGAYLFGAATTRLGTRAIGAVVVVAAALEFLPTPAPTGPMLLQILLAMGPALLLLAFGAAGCLPNLLHGRGPDHAPVVRRFVSFSNAGSFLGLAIGAWMMQSLEAPMRERMVAGTGLALGALALSLPRREGERSVGGIESRQALGTLLAASAIGVLWYLSVHSRIEATTMVSPVLWAVTLGVYLATWVVAFAWPERARLGLVTVVAGVAAVGLVLLSSVPREADASGFTGPVLMGSAAIGLGCLALHLAARGAYLKFPSATRASVMTAAGGALGGLTTALLLPAVVTTQMQIVLAGVALAVVLAASLRPAPLRWGGSGVAAALAVAVFFVPTSLERRGELLRTERTWAGEYQIGLYEAQSDRDRHRVLYSSGTVHGAQYLNPRLQDLPTAYFSIFTGAGRALRATEALRGAEHATRIGVVGLGTGAIAVYGDENDFVRFFEIDRGVVDLARPAPGHVGFTFLELTPATVDIEIGDGRALLAAERERGEPPYDILLIDAFTGDNVPAHLLTVEAFELYAERVARRGILAVHTSNKVLDLRPAVYAAAAAVGARAALVRNRPRSAIEPGQVTHASMQADWVLLWWDDASAAALRAQLSELLQTGEIVVQEAGSVEFAVRGLLTDDRFGVWHLRQGKVGERFADSP